MTYCARPDCDLRVEDWQLACRTHWYQLPPGLRDEIWRAYRRGDQPAHGAAVREALDVWIHPELDSSPPLRCQHCRAPADFVDPDTDRGVCLVCAKAGMSTKTVLQPCRQCGTDVEVLISLTRKPPDLCLDCADHMLQLIESLQEGVPA